MKATLEHLISLTGHTEEDFEILGRHAAITQQWADDAVQAFYDTLFAYPPTSVVFREGERPEREATLRAWYLEVTSGTIRGDFWNHQWIVGLVHIKRQVTNSFMISMVSRLQLVFLEKCLATLDQAAAEAVFGAFKRVTDIVLGLIAEGYHQGYIEAVTDVTGMNAALIDRMADVAVDKLLTKARQG